MAINSMTQAPRKQRGFSIIEMAVGLTVALLMLAIFVGFMTDFARANHRKQVIAQQAQEMAQIARAVKQYIAANGTSFPLNTTNMVAISTLVGAGLLPTSFGNRDGSGGSISPLGRSYTIAVRRLAANDPPTAVVAESGVSLQEKLPALGIDPDDNAIGGLKRDIAIKAVDSYQAVAATIATGTRSAQGVGGTFTKDLSAYFGAAFAETAAAILVNFKDLDPVTTTPTAALPPKKKVYTECHYGTKTYDTRHSTPPIWDGTRYGYPSLGDCRPFVNTDPCPNGEGDHYETSTTITNCSEATIALLPFGGAMTNGQTEVDSDQVQTGSNCPGGGTCYGKIVTGFVTMNNVTIADGLCKTKQWVNGVLQTTPTYQQTAVGVCCSYKWDRPDETCGP